VTRCGLDADRSGCLQKQLTKPYYHPYLEITQPMWIAERESKSIPEIPVYLTVDVGKLEFFDRQPGWGVYTESYLAGGKKVER